MKPLIVFLTLLFLIGIVSAATTITGNFVYDNPTLPHLNPSSNSSLITVNNSIYWQGYVPTTLPHNILAGIQGGSPGEYYHVNQSFFDKIISAAFFWITGENVGYTNQTNTWNGTQTINGNLTVTGTINGTAANSNFSSYSNYSSYAGNSNDSNYLNGYNATTLPHNGLYGLQGNGPDYYHLTLTEMDLVLNSTNATIQGYVPYQGAIKNVNLSFYNLSAGNLYLPTGGQLNFREENITNTTSSYIFYNSSSQRVELWVNGRIQQDWGNSTTIYGTATFQADAFFQNLSGEGLFINTNVLVDGYITAYGNISGTNVFAGNICYSDGTNCTAFNDTVENLTALILGINQSLYTDIWLVNETSYNYTNYVWSILNSSINSVNQSLTNYYSKSENVTPKTNMTYSLGNSTNWWTNLYVGTINAMTISLQTLNAATIYTIDLNTTNVFANAVISNTLSGLLAWNNLTGVPYFLNSTQGPYLYNNNGTVYFNDTQLNQNITSYQYWLSSNGTVYLRTITDHVAVGLNFTNATFEIKGNASNIPITVCNNTVACYRFEEGSGTIAMDSSIYLNLGFIKSNTFANSKGGNGTGNYSIASNSGYIVANDKSQINITDNITVSAWVNITNNADTNYIISKNNDKTLQNGYMFYIKNDKKLYFTVIRNGVTVSNRRTNNNVILAQGGGWHHVAATINGTIVTIYIDGVSMATENGGNAFAGISTDLFIGSDSTTAKYFNGYIDEVGIFNIVLTGSEISTLYNTGFIFANATFLGLSNNPFMITKTNNGDIIVVDIYGRVGINNPNPSATLDVNGTANFVSAHISKDLFVGGTIIGGSPVKISGGLTIISGDINGSESNATFANMYDRDTIDATFINTTTAQQNYISYQGAINDINFTDINVITSQLIIPVGGDLHFNNGSQLNYMTYNISSQRLELWANGRIQQDWGNSTTIYGKATFEADAFFQNLSGEGLFINTNVIVDGNVIAYKNVSAQYIFAGNLCYGDGTNCSYVNTTVANLSQLIMEINQSLSIQIEGLYNYTYNVNLSLTQQIDAIFGNLSNYYNKTESDARFASLTNNTFFGNQNPGTNDTYTLGNSTNIWKEIYIGVINAISMTLSTLNVNWINVNTINATIITVQNLTVQNLNVGNLNASLNWSNIQNIPYYLNGTNSSYLYSINGTLYFNETLNNQTIAEIANIEAFAQTVIVTTANGTGFNVSTPINYYLTQFIVTAPNNTTTFNFQATQNNATGFMIDKDREQHISLWNIRKGYSLTNDTIYLKITNASQDGAYTIIIKYINSKFTYP